MIEAYITIVLDVNLELKLRLQLVSLGKKRDPPFVNFSMCFLDIILHFYVVNPMDTVVLLKENVLFQLLPFFQS